MLIKLIILSLVLGFCGLWVDKTIVHWIWALVNAWHVLYLIGFNYFWMRRLQRSIENIAAIGWNPEEPDSGGLKVAPTLLSLAQLYTRQYSGTVTMSLVVVLWNILTGIFSALSITIYAGKFQIVGYESFPIGGFLAILVIMVSQAWDFQEYYRTCGHILEMETRPDQRAFLKKWLGVVDRQHLFKKLGSPIPKIEPNK